MIKGTLKFSLVMIAALVVTVPVGANETANVINNDPNYLPRNPLGHQESIQVQANNTALNARDRDQNTLTPLDHGLSQDDINTSAKIRKEIMELPGLSVDAQNVKIITQNGKVTLRGPVKTAEEKGVIYELSRSLVGSDNVDNQLEIAGNSKNK